MVARFVEALGVRAVDRGAGSCTHRTAGCAGCYVRRQLRQYHDTRACFAAGGKDDREWSDLSPSYFAGLTPQRFRLCTRGEPFSTLSDVCRIASWTEAAPGVIFWIPTRGWRDPQIKAAVERELLPRRNVRILASVDRETAGETDRLLASGWSVMYFDPDNRKPETTGRVVKCRKTWNHGAGITCATCRGGCFASGSPRVVWLRFHGSHGDAEAIRRAADRAAS